MLGLFVMTSPATLSPWTWPEVATRPEAPVTWGAASGDISLRLTTCITPTIRRSSASVAKAGQAHGRNGRRTAGRLVLVIMFVATTKIGVASPAKIAKVIPGHLLGRFLLMGPHQLLTHSA
jgi:hypothetical protein